MTRSGDIIRFYGKRMWGTLFGVKDAAHPQGHHGHDIRAEGRTLIPALRAGRIVHRGRSGALGYVIVIEHAPGQFDGYAHTIRRIAPWRYLRRVKAGQPIARVAGWSDFHGSSWTGPHLHLTHGPTINSVYGIGSTDPRPSIEAALHAAL